MENVIFVIIGIVWVVYSLYTARQKAIQKQQSSGLPPRGPSSSSPLPIPGNQGGGRTLFEDIFRELSGELRPVPSVDKPVQPAIPVQPVKSAQARETLQSTTRYTSISDIQSDSSPKVSENDRITHAGQEQTTRNERISGKFDLREAVIFSELLNRKYF